MVKRPSSPKAVAAPPSLNAATAAAHLRRQHEKGKQIMAGRPIQAATNDAWVSATSEVLANAFGQDSPRVSEFRSVGMYRHIGGASPAEYEVTRAESTAERLERLAALIDVLEMQTVSATDSVAGPTRIRPVSNRVFLVHGHNEAVLNAVARFLEHLDLEVVILKDEPNRGQTVIEKFVEHSDVGFAVVLLTGDDVGRAAGAAELKPRARQNVILELGYFLAKLGRAHVCALYQGGVEIPSDFSGVLFVPLDPGEAWRLLLAKEMKAAGLSIDMNQSL